MSHEQSSPVSGPAVRPCEYRVPLGSSLSGEPASAGFRSAGGNGEVNVRVWG